MSGLLPPALSGERYEFDTEVGRLSAYVAGEGRPMMLVHSVNAAASAMEVRPLFEHFRHSRRVFAIDLPGYGFSQRGERSYTPRLMTDALHAMGLEIRRRCGNEPIDALALSLASEFVARAAVEDRSRWRSLALISPTGFSGGRERRGPPGSTLGMPLMLAALRGPGWGGALFRGLTRPGVIRYFLQRTWGSKDIDEALWRYAVITARQPGAEFAPLHFVAGYLFSADIHVIYEQLKLPVWMCHGVRGDFTDYRAKSLVQTRPNWRFDVFQTGALPHFEQPGALFAAYEAAIHSVAG